MKRLMNRLDIPGRRGRGSREHGLLEGSRLLRETLTTRVAVTRVGESVSSTSTKLTAREEFHINLFQSEKETG